MAGHILKTWPKPFQDILNGTKKYELRKDDRGFDVGDFLTLREWDPKTKQYTGRVILVKVIHITRYSDKFDGLKDNFVIMGIEFS